MSFGGMLVETETEEIETLANGSFAIMQRRRKAKKDEWNSQAIVITSDRAAAELAGQLALWVARRERRQNNGR